MRALLFLKARTFGISAVRSLDVIPVPVPAAANKKYLTLSHLTEKPSFAELQDADLEFKVSRARLSTGVQQRFLVDCRAVSRVEVSLVCAMIQKSTARTVNGIVWHRSPALWPI